MDKIIKFIIKKKLIMFLISVFIVIIIGIIIILFMVNNINQFSNQLANKIHNLFENNFKNTNIYHSYYTIDGRDGNTVIGDNSLANMHPRLDQFNDTDTYSKNKKNHLITLNDNFVVYNNLNDQNIKNIHPYTNDSGIINCGNDKFIIFMGWTFKNTFPPSTIKPVSSKCIYPHQSNFVYLNYDDSWLKNSKLKPPVPGKSGAVIIWYHNYIAKNNDFSYFTKKWFKEALESATN